MECPHCGGRIKNGACQNCTTPVDLPDTPEATAPERELPSGSDDIPLAHEGFAAFLRLSKADDVPDVEIAGQRWLESMLALTDGYEVDPVGLFSNVVPPETASESTEFVGTVWPSVCAQCFLPLTVEWEIRWTVPEGSTLYAPPAAVLQALRAISRRICEPSDLARRAAALLVDVGCSKAEARAVVRTPCRCDNQGRVFLATLGD